MTKTLLSYVSRHIDLQYTMLVRPPALPGHCRGEEGVLRHLDFMKPHLLHLFLVWPKHPELGEPGPKFGEVGHVGWYWFLKGPLGAQLDVRDKQKMDLTCVGMTMICEKCR